MEVTGGISRCITPGDRDKIGGGVVVDLAMEAGEHTPERWSASPPLSGRRRSLCGAKGKT